MASEKKHSFGIKTYTDEATATRAMKNQNRAYKAAGNKKDLMVLVEGPDLGEWSVMPLEEAIENEMSYSWEI